MQNSPDKNKLKNVGTRAAFGAAGAAPGMAATGGISLLSHAANRMLKKVKDRSPVQPGFETNTAQKVHNLAVKLLGVGKYPGSKDISVNVGERLPAIFLEGTKRNIPPGAIKPMDILQLPVGVNSETLSHEVGHAIPKSRLASLNRRLATLLQRKPALAIPSLLALTGALRKDDGDVPITSKVAPYVGAAQLASVLAEESRANIVGAKLLKQLGKKMSLSNKLRMFIPTATYLGLGGALLGAPIGIQKSIEAYNRAKDRGANPKTKQLLSSTPQRVAETPTVQELQKKWGPLFEEYQKQ